MNRDLLLKRRHQVTDGAAIEHTADNRQGYADTRFALPDGGAAAQSGLGLNAVQVPEKHFDVVVIGAGQAGLSVGYHLARHGISFVILEGSQRVGDSWRTRWDSLRLFSPARFDGLDGMRFPKSASSFPSKDEMADYLEAYAERFSLPIHLGIQVDRVSRSEGRYLVEAGATRFGAAHVVIAMSGYRRPKVPAFADSLSPDLTQLHSLAYRNPSQLRPGRVLVVGAGNSGAEIALELAHTGHEVVLSGRDTGHVPFRIETYIFRHLISRVLFRLVFHRILTADTRFGRKARLNAKSGGLPLIRTKPADLAAAGINRVGRMVGVSDGLPMLEDGLIVDVRNVVWATGFDNDLTWIDRPIFDVENRPIHSRGVVKEEIGLYFVGLPFLYAMSSAMIHGVGRDARYVVNTIAARLKSNHPPFTESISP
jgi:putative flavoprotein involved in K+ transport